MSNDYSQNYHTIKECIAKHRYMFNGNRMISIEGLDGSGKTTQINLLQDYLKRNNHKVRFVHFPRHNMGVYGKLISRFLRGEFGKLEDVHPQLVAVLFAEDRKEAAPLLQYWMSTGYVLMDRYVLSNNAFQGAKLESPDEKEALNQWIEDFEYNNNGIPRPGLSIYLDVPPSFTAKSLADRKGDDRNYLAGDKDIHEDDLEFQSRVRQEYLKLAEKDKSIVVIHCIDGDGNMKSIQEIHDMILYKCGCK